MNFNIKSPVEGKVILEMTWDEAEIATRLLGLANSGNMERFAPGLHEFVLSMVENVGRNVQGDANAYVASIGHNSQVYIRPVSQED